MAAVPQVRQLGSFAQAVVSLQQLVSLQVLQVTSANSRPHVGTSQAGSLAHAVAQLLQEQSSSLV